MRSADFGVREETEKRKNESADYTDFADFSRGEAANLKAFVNMKPAQVRGGERIRLVGAVELPI